MNVEFKEFYKKTSIEFCKRNIGFSVCPECKGAGFVGPFKNKVNERRYFFCRTCRHSGVLAWTEAIRKGVILNVYDSD